MSYAQGTVVTEDESQAEIRVLLTRHGATSSVVGLNASEHAVVKFTLKDRDIKILVHLPIQSRERPRRWRVLALLLKAKLEAVESGISTVNDEFLAYIAMPGGTTAGQMMAPKVSEAYRLQQGAR